MKKITILLSALLGCAAAFGQQIIDIATGEALPLTMPTHPERTKQVVDDGMIVSYTFTNMRLDSIDVDGRTAFVPVIAGFGQFEGEGEPALCHRFDFMQVPTGCDITVSLEEYEYCDYFFEVAPAELPLFDRPRRKSLTINTVTTSGFYPTEIVTLLKVNESRTHGRIAYIKITPIVYDHTTKSLRVPTKIVYKINYNGLGEN